MKKAVLLVVAMLLISVTSNVCRADEPDPKKQAELLEKIEKLQRQIEELKALKQQKLSLPVKMDQCMKVVGVESYCKCVVEKLPGMVDFKQFVEILLTKPADLGYDKMSADQKKDVDSTLVVWAKCVDYKGPKGSGMLDNIMNRETLF